MYATHYSTLCEAVTKSCNPEQDCIWPQQSLTKGQEEEEDLSFNTTVLPTNFQIFSHLPLSLIPGRGTCHRPNRLQEAHHASWVGRVDVVGGGACLHVSRTAQEQMLCRLVVASAVWT